MIGVLRKKHKRHDSRRVADARRALKNLYDAHIMHLDIREAKIDNIAAANPKLDRDTLKLFHDVAIIGIETERASAEYLFRQFEDIVEGMDG